MNVEEICAKLLWYRYLCDNAARRVRPLYVALHESNELVDHIRYAPRSDTPESPLATDAEI